MMQISEQNQIALNEQLAFVSCLREAVGSIVFLNSILSTSKKEWDACSNIDNDEHLIRGIATSPIKTDACNTYVSKLIKHYLTSEGTRATAWTKNTISSENFTNKSIASIIAAHTFYEHTELFKIVATRLMGFDDTLVDLALALGSEAQAEQLVIYLGGRFDLVEALQVVEVEDVKFSDSVNKALLDRYSHAVAYFKAALDEGRFNETFYINKSQAAIQHFTTEPEPGDLYIYDRLDLLTQE